MALPPTAPGSRVTPGAARRRAATAAAALLAALLTQACGARAVYDASRIADEPPGAWETDEQATDALPASRGIASWYGANLHGNPTASGEPFDMYAFTAAHRRLRFGSWVRVTRVDDGRSTIVRINDRGPFTAGRIIDLSWAAAHAIGMVEAGVVEVTIEVLRRGGD
jgi:rare lipoprotein A